MTTKSTPTATPNAASFPELRVPLYPTELAAAPCTVCVTGATGFAAGAIVKRLLAGGHTVHATVRSLTSPKNSHLLAMPGAAQRLKLFEADCLKAGSFDAAVQGCKYVLHTASPVIMTPKRGKERELLIEPAIKGVDNCVAAVEKAVSTVEALVLTSSYFAIWSNNANGGVPFTEEDWNEISTEQSLPYARSKVVAERRAWELHAKQAGPKKWRLACINPGFIVGPPEMAKAPSETATFLRMMLNGDMGGVCLPLGLPWVDVEDVASAHILAALTPTATGRYLCSSEAGTVPDILQGALTAYPEPLARCRIGLKKMPKFVGQVLGFFGMYPGELIRGQWDVVPAFDNGKARKELGMRFMPVSRSVADMAQRFIDLGEVKPKV